MKNIRVKFVQCAAITFVNDEGRTVLLPLYAHEGNWRSFGSYQTYGSSRSDPTYAEVRALPYKWKPSGKLLSAIRRSPR